MIDMDVQNAMKERMELQNQIEMLENITRRYLSKEAIMRYGNLKAVHPEKALQVIAFIAQLIKNGHINEKISDQEFKDMLIKIDDLSGKKEFKFIRK